jgi:hypothetical protein
VISSSRHAAILLAKSLNESNFQLILTTKNQSIINFQILEVSDSASQGIVELKLNYSSVPEISKNVSLFKFIFKDSRHAASYYANRLDNRGDRTNL